MYLFQFRANLFYQHVYIQILDSLLGVLSFALATWRGQKHSGGAGARMDYDKVVLTQGFKETEKIDMIVFPLVHVCVHLKDLKQFWSRCWRRLESLDLGNGQLHFGQSPIFATGSLGAPPEPNF